MEATLCLILDQLLSVLGLLVFECHRVHNAFYITKRLVASGFFRELGEGSGLGHDRIHKFAIHRLGHTAEIA
jgi:hypothetical protein